MSTSGRYAEQHKPYNTAFAAESVDDSKAFDQKMLPTRSSLGQTSTSDSNHSVLALDSQSGDRQNSSIKRHFTAAWVQKRHPKPNGEDVSGTVGLQLLHSSPEPQIDLIFVHGLRGGSTKTWCKGNNPQHFWPQSWLPLERGFHNVNIHSFGYDSDWASTKSSILNVHDFGQSLLEEMRNSPHLKENGKNGPIVLVGHSMGGLVIKKAYILSLEAPDFAGRIQCIFFLATPHRGSDYSALLNNILLISGVLSPRDYIRDIESGSRSAQRLNEDFYIHAHDLKIFSFYETLRMNMGLSSGLIVDKASAVLGSGFVNERVQYLNANHREICKFSSPEDPNYVTFKNALLSAIQDLVRDDSAAKDHRAREVAIIRSYLGILEQSDDCYCKVDGSCQWIDDRDDFQDWRDGTHGFVEKGSDGHENIPSIFWVHANPGTGKTFLAAHVISELQEFHVQCSYYYFHVGSKASRSLSDFLTSIAYQMAASNTVIRESLTKLRNEASHFDLDNSRAIWNTIFKKIIFRARVYTPQYWVIDAMDECTKFPEFFSMLKGERPNFPLRIFLTSRNLPEMTQIQRSLEASVTLTSIEIPVANTLDDIRCYIDNRIDNLAIDDFSERQKLASNILRRSNACFLWVRLVLDELERVYSLGSMVRVLEKIPEEMVPYYGRTIKAMNENTTEKHIAKAVLLWVVASSRKISIQELSQALKLDTKEDLPSTKNAVKGLCGQLVVIDEESGLVEVVHPTVREFLLSEAAGEFRVLMPLAHEKIALTCLRLLASREMQPLRGRRMSAQPQAATTPFLSYAISQFSEHIYGTSSDNDELVLEINRFLQSNVLIWIERLAAKGDLHCVIRTSKNLKAYLEQRAKYRSSLNAEVQNIEAWSVDLSRLVTRFGAALLQNPSSIYGLIPPLCPSDSAICRQFRKRPDGLAIVGFKNKAWDDCIASVGFGKAKPVAMSCGENQIAVSLVSGKTVLYNHQSCQRVGIVRNEWPVDIVHFTDNHIAVFTIKFLLLKSLDGSLIWQTKLKSRCIHVTSTGDFIYAVTQRGHLLKWNIQNGNLQEYQAFKFRNHNNQVDYNRLADTVPTVASLSPDIETLALAYGGGTVCLWDIQSEDFIGWALDDDDRIAGKMLFNPNPDINLLLIIYTNHKLALFDAACGSLVTSAEPSEEAGVLSASCSPDGRTFATCNTLMSLQVWDFMSLSLLYHLESPYAPFRVLSFTSDGSSIVDVTAFGMRIWSPAVLVRRTIEEDADISDVAMNMNAIKGRYEPLRSARVTALQAHPSLPLIFAGKYNGQVAAYDTNTGEQIALLYTHPHDEYVTELAVSKDNFISSSDINGVVQVWKLDTEQMSDPRISLVLRVKSQGPVKCLRFSGHGNYLLVSTTSLDRVYCLTDGLCVGTLRFDSNPKECWQWVSIIGPVKDERFVLLHNRVLKTYQADAFPRTVDELEVSLQYEFGEGEVEHSINQAVLHEETQTLAIEVQYGVGYVFSSTTLLFRLSEKSALVDSTMPSRSTLTPFRRFGRKQCQRLVGFGRRARPGAVVFLRRDSWLSSANAIDLTRGQYKQHFFVPNEYVPSSHETRLGIWPITTADDDVVFCIHGALAIVRNGLRFQETRNLETKQLSQPGTTMSGSHDAT